MAVGGVVPLCHPLDEPQRHQQTVQVGLVNDIDGHIGFHPHNGQVDGPQAQLGEDARQDGGDSAGGVQEPRHKPGQHPSQQGRQQGQPQVGARAKEYDEHSAPCAEGAVHGQVRNIQNFVGNVYADCHNAPDQPLGYGPRQRADESHHKQTLLSISSYSAAIAS